MTFNKDKFMWADDDQLVEVTVPVMSGKNSGEKVRNYYVDDELNRDWLKAVPKIRMILGIKEKMIQDGIQIKDVKQIEAILHTLGFKGRFVTIDGQPVFVGGPGQGSGGAGGTVGQFSMFTEEEFEAMTDPSIRDANELEERMGGAARFEDADDAQYYGDEMWEEWRDDLESDESLATTLYSGDAYDEFNGALRHGDPPGPAMESAAFEYFVDSGMIDEDQWDEMSMEYTDEFASLMIRSLDDALERGSSPEDMVVFRATKAHLFEGLQPGDVWRDDGFVSTSLHQGKTSSFGDFHLEILVPEGSPGGFLDGLSQHANELEFLMPSGSQFRILARTENGAVLELQ